MAFPDYSWPRDPDLDRRAHELWPTCSLTSTGGTRLSVRGKVQLLVILHSSFIPHDHLARLPAGSAARKPGLRSDFNSPACSAAWLTAHALEAVFTPPTRTECFNASCLNIPAIGLPGDRRGCDFDDLNLPLFSLAVVLHGSNVGAALFAD